MSKTRAVAILLQTIHQVAINGSSLRVEKYLDTAPN